MFYGWKVVAVAFLIAVYAWGISFYGPSLYLVELAEIHHWPVSEISTAFTFFYIFSAVLLIFVGDVFTKFGPRLGVSVGACAMALGLVGLGLLDQIWQLYVTFSFFAVGWALMSSAAINNILAPWFDRKRGFAISLALAGASASGVILVPIQTYLLLSFGFAIMTQIIALSLIVLLIPLCLVFLHRGPEVLSLVPDGEPGVRRDPKKIQDSFQPALTRIEMIRTLHFWSICSPFSLALLAQVGLLTHFVAIITPHLGKASASVCLSLATMSALTGRVVVGVVIDRVDRRYATVANFMVQVLGIFLLLTLSTTLGLYIGSVLFGLGVGNTITFPALIVQEEYPVKDFAKVISFITAVNQLTFSLGPATLGWIRDLTNSYNPALLLSIGLMALSTAIIFVGRGKFNVARSD